MVHTFDHSKQETQIENLTSRRRAGVHASNCLVSLTNSPNSTPVIPNKVLWKLLVEMVVCSSSNKIRILIGLEPTQQLSVLDIVYHLLQWSSSTKDNVLLVRKMYRKTVDSRPLLMHWKLKDIVASLGG